MRWHPGTLHCWRLHPRLLEGDHQHGGNEDGSGDGDIDVALGEGQDQHESDGDFNPILFQEATFASGDKNKAVRYLWYIWLGTC